MTDRIKNALKWRLRLYSEKLFSGKSYFTRKKTLLIVRLDAIGDYILFRNFIGEIKNSERFRGYRIALCGNIAWKDLAETFDKDTVDEFIWIEIDKFMDGPKRAYRYLKFLKLHLSGYEILIQPNDTKTKCRDYLVRDSGAKHIIGAKHDSLFLFDDNVKNKSNPIDELIEPVKESIFQFERNKDFTESLLGKKINYSIPHIDIHKKRSEFYSIVIFPGAGQEYREWSPENFAMLCRKISNGQNIKFIICGGKKEKKIGNVILQKAKLANIVDLTGKTTLPELVKLIADSDLLISNESCAVHIAAATSTKAICISNGNHFGRFNPYPVETGREIITIYPEHVTKNLSDQEHLVREYSIKSDLDINSITVENVYEQVARILDCRAELNGRESCDGKEALNGSTKEYLLNYR